MNGLQYTSPAPHFNGNVPLAIAINDNGNTGSGGPVGQYDRDSESRAANDLPIIVVPGHKSIAQNFPTPIAGISVSDVDVGSAS